MAVRLDHDGVANRAFALPEFADAREGPAVQRRTLESQPAADQPDDNTPFRMITRIKGLERTLEIMTSMDAPPTSAATDGENRCEGDPARTTDRG